MTAENDLLPLPSVLLNWPHPTNHAAIRDYARANLAELQREVEALRAEVESITAEAFEWRDRFTDEKARAERLAEALRGIETKLVHSMDHAKSSLERKRAMSECADAARAALEQENDDA